MGNQPRFFLWGGLFLVSVSVQAKPRSGIPPTDFLGKPVGARLIGMGEVGAALSGSASSPIYNPASLGEVAGTSFSADFQVANQTRLPQAVLLRSSSLRGKKLTYLGFAGKGRAVFYRPLADYDEVTVTDVNDPVHSFTQDSLQVDQYGLSASQEAEKGYSVGLGLSYLMARRGRAVAKAGEPPVLELANGNGFAVDLGFRDQKEGISYGLSVKNIVALLYWDKYKTDQLPVLLRAGFGVQPVPAFGFYSDYEKRFFAGSTPDTDAWHFGMEMAPIKWLVLRAGAVSEDFNDRSKTDFSYGFSFGDPQKYLLDASTKTRKVENTQVRQFDVSLVFLLPSSGGE